MNSKREKKAVYKEIDLDLIMEVEGRLRLEIDEEQIEELARSIESLGLRQAIEVVKKGEKYEIVYGERRYLAHKRLGREKIMAKIVELTDDEIAVIRAMENVARKNLSPIEEAVSFQDLKTRFNLTTKEVGKKVGRSYGNVKRRIDLLEMDTAIQKAVHTGKIKVALAEELRRCPDTAHRSYLLEMAVEHGVTKAVLRQWVEDFNTSERARVYSGEEVGRGSNIMETKPIYQACDVCDEAVKIEELQHMGICKGCGKKLSQARE